VAQVPGSTFRRTLFWAHLTAGVSAGLIILVMSATGVLLTYEAQILSWASQDNHVHPPAGAAPLSADRLAELARVANPEAVRASLRWDADPTAPVSVTLGREGSILLDPYSGAVITDAAAGYRQFFRVVENWHRWLGGSPQSTRATMVDISNLMFLFLVVSGIYLWLPAVWRWEVLRRLMFFSPKYVNSKARDFAWHHVFSIWALIPLFLVVLSGVVMSFGWASNFVYAAYGEQPPQRRNETRQRSGPELRSPRGENREGRPEPPAGASLDSLLNAARAGISNWQRLTVPISTNGREVTITAELKSAETRAPRQTIVLSAADASLLSLSAPQSNARGQQSAGQRARTWFRFVHTGEQYGVIGQTIAGLASLAACFLVYSGLALAWRRLIVPLIRAAPAA
jgi:uncharacterized iron-regulated membrane protein